MANSIEDFSEPKPEYATAKSTRAAAKRAKPNTFAPVIDTPEYTAPDFSSSRRARIGSSIIEQFVAGHDANDVLRELVQNEYDGGGTTMTLNFGSRSLEVTGTGRNIDTRGWKRLSVILGTGNVMGSRQGEVVASKQNGIGSKNFGLRSLFRFGDKIYVRSGGRVALLALQTLETGLELDPETRGTEGVRIHVPYRLKSTEILEAFTLEREQHALGLIAAGLRDTLVKLAHSGKRPGLREVNIRSSRTGQTLSWKQDAKPGRCGAANVNMVVRSGRLVLNGTPAVSFQEDEFSRSIAIPTEYGGRRFPAYYKLPGGRIKIALSVPTMRKRIHLGQDGHLYYPLKAPSSRTGCALSISAPFQLNTDRSGITDHVWNDWLIDQAVELTIYLLRTDWFDRYGASAYKALLSNTSVTPDRFSSEIAKRLKTGACWPTRGTGKNRFASASKIVLPEKEEFGGLLDGQHYLDATLTSDAKLCELASSCGAKLFTTSSLVRLRCAGSDASFLATKMGNDEASYCYTDYRDALTEIDIQKRLAAALSAHPRRLTKQHNADLANTISTLSALGQLKPAAQLIIVDPALWDNCPEPEANRLHPELTRYKEITKHCRPFEEDKWLMEAARRAATASFDDRERETLYRRLLTRKAPLGRAIRTTLRSNPVLKNQRGQWVAPASMVHLKGQLAHLLDPAINAPSEEVLNAPKLLIRLQIRRSLNGSDLTSFARTLPERPLMAKRFEKLLRDNLRLLTSTIVEDLREIPCLKALSNELMSPAVLHLNTATNRLCIGDDSRIVGGASGLLYRKLRLKAAPDVKTLLDIIELHRERDEAPAHPDILYPALVEAISRERRPKSTVADLPICWVDGAYVPPSKILVGPRVPSPLVEAIPVYHNLDKVGRAYQELGAPGQPDDSHWICFFRHVGTEWASEAPVNARQRRILLEAYSVLGSSGLPPGTDNVRCLIDDRKRLFTLAELRAGELVEPDFGPLEDALRAANSKIGIIDRSERSRAFFGRLGIRPLSTVAGAGEPKLGLPARPLPWYSIHCERALAMLHWPIFGYALSEVAYHNRSAHFDFAPLHQELIEARLSAIREIVFVQKIEREYSVGGTRVLIPAQVAISGERIAIIAPRTKNGFQLSLSEALAELTGATSLATMRSIANSFLPLVLCGTSEDLRDYFDRMGIPLGRLWDAGEESTLEFEISDNDDLKELALRQVFDDLDTIAVSTLDQAELVDIVRKPTIITPQLPASHLAQRFELPDIDDVSLLVSANSETTIEPRGPSMRVGSSSGGWLPPTPAEVERNALFGRRGEELVYRLELQRVRDMGYGEPERYVIWTSRDEPGADHDIRTIDDDGEPRWIEVKSTTGDDGRFEWPCKEFEKALRERDRYDLWRVYRVADSKPVAKRFRNPSQMLVSGQLALELGMLRASLEPLS